MTSPSFKPRRSVAARMRHSPLLQALLLAALLAGHILAGSAAAITSALDEPYAMSTAAAQGESASAGTVNVSASAGEPQQHHRRMLASCSNQDSRCAGWVGQGYCDPKWYLSGQSIRNVVCPLACGTCSGSSGGSSGSGNAVLSQTNMYRQKHHAPALSWDNTVVAHAQAWANTLASGCKFEHGGMFSEGQNLFASGGSQYSWSQVVDSWYNEVKQYKFSARPWTDNQGNFGAIGHFTQLVWVGTTRLGCAMATNSGCKGVQYYYVCNYAPQGNMMGDSSFKANVLQA